VACLFLNWVGKCRDLEVGNLRDENLGAWEWREMVLEKVEAAIVEGSLSFGYDMNCVVI
jgi:hypothetical protein